uniref:Expansin-like CBD domain-containing protein n=1 Tax=Oryza rufipogon TaxID=4529 RepID=A0A0E0QFM0_ORYRU
MAKPGLNDKLRHSGIIDIHFRREGSNPVYFAVLVKYEDLDGDVVQVDLMESKSAYGGAIGVWTPMRESWGSASAATPARPFVTNNVIPANWSRIAPSLPPSPLPRRPRSLRARPLPRLSRLGLFLCPRLPDATLAALTAAPSISAVDISFVWGFGGVLAMEMILQQLHRSTSLEMDPHSHKKAHEGLIGDNPDAYAVTTYQPVLMVEPSAAAAFPPAPQVAPAYPVNPMQLPEHQQHAIQQVQQLQQQQKEQLQAFWADQMAEVEQMTEFKLPNLPLARIKKIMKADEDVKMIAGEAPALFAKACEMFILDMTLRSWQHTEEGRRRTLQRSDVEAVIKKTDIFDFLVDIITDDKMKDDGMGSQAASMVSPYTSGGMGFSFDLYPNQHHLAYMWPPQEQQEQWPPQEQQEQKQKQDSDGGGQDE